MYKSMYSRIISNSLGIAARDVQNTIDLLESGATIPFISRYRKEMTNGLNEVDIERISNSLDAIKDIEKRKQTILETIEQQGKLTSELNERIENCWDKSELEDIYLPYKPKRRTKAEIAKSIGLENLANIIQKQSNNSLDAVSIQFVRGDVTTSKQAVDGACDIIAERVSENEYVRNTVRNIYKRTAIISAKIVKGKEEDGNKFANYLNFSEKLSRCSSHKILAIRRGESEGILKVSISIDDDEAIKQIKRLFVKADNELSKCVERAVIDGYKRLVKPSIENEFAQLSKEKADDEAIIVFHKNLKQLLLAPPLGSKRILAIDPGYRTGCKVVCLDEKGNLLHNENIYPHQPVNDKTSASKIRKMIEAYNIDAITIGNGTASRETENFIKSVSFNKEISIFVVSEQGASIYSASKIAREEFPDYDVTVRGAVSIGRRLMDPLAELVKIEPKSIGVGQYQHDVDQIKLKKALEQCVINCVNLVGVDVNTASKHLLTYVSGLGNQLAQNIVDYRDENGKFTSKTEIMKVKRMGAKAFEQCAGFLRITDAKNPLDRTSVHPESYHIVEQMAFDLNCSIEQLVKDKSLRDRVDINKYVGGNIGLPTLKDIMEELNKPGRDPRREIKVFEFDSNIRTILDLKVGMVLNGIVTNITNFGVFVDIGIKENGLVHISELSDHYVSSPSDVVAINQTVSVKVLEVDTVRNRISLSMK